MALRILRIFFLIATVGALYTAYVEWEDGNLAKTELMAELPLFSAAMSEIEELSKLDIRALRSTDEALEELVARLIDDTELLGSSVRIEFPDRGLVWQPINFGVSKAQLSIGTAADSSGALGYFYILWQLILAQPVQVIGASIRRTEGVVMFNVDLELFAVQDIQDTQEGAL